MNAPEPLDPRICIRALNARDPRFDGVFFVGVATTGIYCRPVCPSRLARDANRRFFDSAAAAEREGFRPCLRCRPELAPGRALCDAVSHLANAAVARISAGALNGRSVVALARELGVSERHLRRVLQREIGVSPLELAQTHRLLLAKRLLADTALPVTGVAYASGFESLRRFNAVFRARYGMSPNALRRSSNPAGRERSGGRRPGSPPQNESASLPARDAVRLTLAYRAPMAWGALLALLRRDLMPGVEVVQGNRYGRTVCVDGRTGFVFAEDAGAHANGTRHAASTHVNVDVSLSLLPVLMAVLARLRRLFDLDAEPALIDACLEQGGLGDLVRQRPGLRVPGAFDGFEIALGALLRGRAKPGRGPSALVARVVGALGEPAATGIPPLARLAPRAERVAEVGAAGLEALGVPRRRAAAAAELARRVAAGTLRLEPRGDAAAAHEALTSIDGVGEQAASLVLMRALRWPDAFPMTDPALRRAAGTPAAGQFRERADRWRPWRAYAAMHLWLQDAA